MSRHASFALTVVVAAAVALGAWYWFDTKRDIPSQTLVIHAADFAPTVQVSGTVVAARTVDLGFAQSGRVSHIYAAVGEQVRAGDLIAETENGDIRALVAQKKAALDAAQANLDSLKAGTRPEAIAVTQAQIAGDETALQQANAALMNAIQDAYTAVDGVIRNTADQFINNPHSQNPSITFSTSNSQSVTTLAADRVAMEATLVSWHSEVNQLSPAADLSSAADDSVANLSQAATLLADASTALSSAVAGSVSQTQITAYAASVATARTSINAAQNALTGAVSAQKAAVAALNRDRKTLALQQSGATADDLAGKQALVSVAEADLTAARAQLEKTQIVAPFSGTVTRMDAKTGSIVSPNDSQISMISNGTFQIETYVPEVSIALIHVGNSATTTLDAYGDGEFFPATVVAVDPAETIRGGISTYKTTLQFLADDPRIRSGMTADVSISGSVSPNTIIIPFGAVFEKNGQRMVQVLNGTAVSDVPVTLGRQQQVGNVEVTSGLRDGDVIVLDPGTSR